MKQDQLYSESFDLPVLPRSKAAWHVIFWVSFLVYEGLIWGTVDGEYLRRTTISSIELPVKIIATYFTLYVLIDKLLMRKKYVLFLGGMLVSMVVFGILLRIVAYYAVYPIFYPDALDVPLFFPPKILIYIFTIYSLVAILASFHLIKYWYGHQQAAQLLQQRAQHLEKEKLEAELKLLKSQINPHFLFNTLNNLYVLTLENSHKAPEMVYKLSELMSYMLYESNQPQVLLKTEIKYIENYISLERIRYDANLDVSLNVYDDIDGIKIAPLLILPFVENGFKHGVFSRISPGWIRIDVSVAKSGMLTIKVENSKCLPGEEHIPKTLSGIGLQNVRQRLDLIYENRYDLQLFDEEETFLAVLKIQLTPEEIQRTNKPKKEIAL